MLSISDTLSLLAMQGIEGLYSSSTHLMIYFTGIKMYILISLFPHTNCS